MTIVQVCLRVPVALKDLPISLKQIFFRPLFAVAQNLIDPFHGRPQRINFRAVGIGTAIHEQYTVDTVFEVDNLGVIATIFIHHRWYQ